MERLTAEDRIMLLGDEAWPQDIGAVGVLDGRSLLDPDGRVLVERVRATVEGRLPLLPRFRQVLYQPQPWLGGPLWVDAPAFDLEDHVRTAPVPTPGGEAELLATVERLRQRRLDPSRPLWELWLLPGLPDGRLGLFVRMHHVIADGMAGATTLATLLDPRPDAAVVPPPPWTPTPAPTTRALVGDTLARQVDRVGWLLSRLAHPVTALRRVREAWPTMRWMLTAEPGPRTSLDVVVGPGRSLALVRSPLGPVREVARTHGAKVNDVLLTLVAGGLRGLLHGRGEVVEDLVLPIYVPVSLRREGPRPETGNLVSQMVVPLPVGTADPARRLEQVAVETARRKAGSHPSVGTLAPGRIGDRLVLRIAARRRVNLTSADVPGPPTRLFFAGAPLLEVFPMIPLIGNVSLGVGALSYAGQLNLMAIADRDAFPDLDVFAQSARDELRALLAGSAVDASRAAVGDR